MSPVLPPRFLFRYSIPVAKVDDIPRSGSKLLDLPRTCELPDFADLENTSRFAHISAAWNEGGLGVAVTVSGKTLPIACDRNVPTESDGLQLWIDTRNTQSIHRSSRFCHHFCLLPAGGGAKGDKPFAIQLPIARAKEETPIADSKRIRIAAEKLTGGYRLEVWLSADVLNGFDPDANPRLGFYYQVIDAELGEQFLSVGRDFPFAHDPSLWSTLELVTRRDASAKPRRKASSRSRSTSG